MNGTVQHNLDSLGRALELSADEALAAGVRSMNRAATTVRAESVRHIAEFLPGLKLASIRRQTKIDRASNTTRRAIIEISAKRFRLYSNFTTRQSKHGVPLRRFPWRMESADGEEISPAELRKAFIQRGRQSGRPNVWVRLGKQRFPITAIFAASAAMTFRERNLGPELMDIGRQRLKDVYEQETRFLLSRRRI